MSVDNLEAGVCIYFSLAWEFWNLDSGGYLHTEVSVQISFFHLPNKIYLIKYLESVRRSNLTANVLCGFA